MSKVVRSGFVQIILSILLSNIVLGQENIPLGSWRIHISFNKLVGIANAEPRIIAVADNGILILDKTTTELNTISKIDGLSSGQISAIGYNQSKGIIIVGFTSGLINFISESEIIELDRISTSTAISGSKKINHIHILNNLAYLSSDFGVVVLDLNNLTVKETYRDLGATGDLLKIVKSVNYQDSLFLATEKGILSGSLDPSSNLLDFRNWNRYDRGELDTEVGSITSFNDHLFASIDGEGIYKLNTGLWSKESFFQNEDYNDISASVDHLLIATPGFVHLVNEQGQSSIVSTGEFTNPIRVAEDASGTLWIADEAKGLLSFSNSTYSNFTPSGPSGNEPWRLHQSLSAIINLRGGYANLSAPLMRTGIVDRFEEGQWTNKNLALTNDITDFAVFGDRDYYSSFGYGLQSIASDQSILVYDDSNSPLVNNDPPNNAVLIPSIQSGNDGVWVANYASPNSLHLLKPDLSWESFSFPISQTQYPTELLVDGLGQVWMLIDPARGGGVFVFNRNSNKSVHLINQAGKGGLPSNTVLSIAMDREGQIWIGTDEGVAYFPDPKNIFDNNVDVVRPIFESRFLLREESVHALSVDGGNRKWFGTDNGVWLFDSSGETLIYNFTSETSPLLSNKVVSIAIQQSNGEVFFASEAGLSSFRSDATESTLNFASVKIFPNPVTREFNGLIAINGLYRDARVKITDISGRLVWETKANGGTASWNARQLNGDRVGSGMYLVFATSENGDERHVGKIAIVD